MRGLQDIRSDPKANFTVLWAAFFFQGLAPGFWVPALTNIMRARGLGDWVPAAFMVSPVCSLAGPLILGALADQRIPADRVFAWSSLICSLALAAAFGSLDAGWHPLWFLGCFGFFSFFSGPTWGLLATISLTNLPEGERRYPQVRVGATIGWVIGGILTSYLLHADTSPVAGYAAAGTRLLVAAVALLLPHTPPLGSGASWRSRLGLDAFSLMRQRDHRVFFGVTALFAIPLTAYYMYAPEFLRALGDPHPTGTMSIGQVLEVAAMLLLGAMLTRYSVKVVLSWALGLSALRYGLSAWAGVTGAIGWHIAGVALHGVCYTFYFITAQVFLDRRVDAGLKGQAQGLLAMITGGIGPLAGAAVCGWLRIRCVTGGVHGWEIFWAILAAMIGGCFALFALCYKGLGKPRPEHGA